MNLHAVGASLLNTMRPSVAAFDVVYKRGDMTSELISAGSPPMGHQFLPGMGVELDEKSRQFIIDKDLIHGLFGNPQRGDVIVDMADGSRWSVRPADGLQEAWRWHGQTRSAYFIHTRRES